MEEIWNCQQSSEQPCLSHISPSPLAAEVAVYVLCFSWLLAAHVLLHLLAILFPQRSIGHVEDIQLKRSPWSSIFLLWTPSLLARSPIPLTTSIILDAALEQHHYNSSSMVVPPEQWWFSHIQHGPWRLRFLQCIWLSHGAGPHSPESSWSAQLPKIVKRLVPPVLACWTWLQKDQYMGNQPRDVLEPEARIFWTSLAPCQPLPVSHLQRVQHEAIFSLLHVVLAHVCQNIQRPLARFPGYHNISVHRLSHWIGIQWGWGPCEAIGQKT